MLHMIYPQNRMIEESVVIIWGHDLLVNQAYKSLSDADRLNDEIGAGISASIPTPSLDEAIEALEDAGEVTFKR